DRCRGHVRHDGRPAAATGQHQGRPDQPGDAPLRHRHPLTRPSREDAGEEHRQMRLPVALIQLDASGDVDASIAREVALTEAAAAVGARLVHLAEYLQFRAGDDGFRGSARPIPGPFTDAFAEVARRHGIWILAGSLAETSDDPARPSNSSALIRPDGSIAA